MHGLVCVTMVDIPEPDELVKLVSQRTIAFEDGQKIEEFVLDVYSVNPVAAKTRARRWVRTEAPFAVNILNPELEDTEQSTLRDFFTNSINLKYRRVEVKAVVEI